MIGVSNALCNKLPLVACCFCGTCAAPRPIMSPLTSGLSSPPSSPRPPPQSPPPLLTRAGGKTPRLCRDTTVLMQHASWQQNPKSPSWGHKKHCHLHEQSAAKTYSSGSGTTHSNTQLRYMVWVGRSHPQITGSRLRDTRSHFALFLAARATRRAQRQPAVWSNGERRPQQQQGRTAACTMQHAVLTHETPPSEPAAPRGA